LNAGCVVKTAAAFAKKGGMAGERVNWGPVLLTGNIWSGRGRCGVTTHVVRLKLFRLKAEGGRKARLPYFGGM